MKILAISDLHLDWSTLGVSRHAEIRDTMLGEVAGVVRDKKIDCVFVLGDLTDPDSGSSALRAISTCIEFAQCLSHMDVDSYWIAGNHDVVEDGSGTTTLSPMAAMHDPMVHVFERPGFYDMGKHEFVALPFTASSHGYDPELFLKSRIEDGKSVIVVGHLTVPGVQPGEETTEMPRGREVTFPVDVARSATLAMNGHYHRQQKTENGVWIPGSLARLTFGEKDHAPGYLLIEV